MHLTFDDGPGDYTAAILDVLAEHGQRATFFVLGQHVEGREDVLRRALADGHELGNHSWDHPNLTELAGRDVRDQLARTSDAIERATGRRPSRYRPPFGEANLTVDVIAAELGLERVSWDLDSHDWGRPGADVIAERLRGAGPDDVVLMHDGGEPTREQTVEALRAALGATRQM